MKGNEYLIDIHSHIVFDVDDGARNLEESLKLIDMAMGQGIKKIIATPHTMPNLKPEEIIEKINSDGGADNSAIQPVMNGKSAC